jgi:hypothetical protein
MIEQSGPAHPILRYVRCMKHSRLFPAILLLCVDAWAQPAPNAEGAATQRPLEQRRAELREALKSSRGQEIAAKAQTPNGVPEKRHLSAQERSDLRQQLRQQRIEGKPDRPS